MIEFISKAAGVGGTTGGTTGGGCGAGLSAFLQELTNTKANTANATSKFIRPGKIKMDLFITSVDLS